MLALGQDVAYGAQSGQSMQSTALANSVNTAFVALEAKVGICQVRDVAQALGVRQSDGQDLQPLPSLTLGASPTAALPLAAAYATFAADGRYCEPTPLASATGPSGALAFDPQCRQVLDPAIAEQVRQALREVVNSGTGTSASIPGTWVGGKTGTTDTSASTWFTGITTDLAASVWVGDPAGGSYRSIYGGDVAAPLWRRIIEPVAG